MTSHIWKLVTKKESLWVRYIHAYKLKDWSFWDVSLAANGSWGWRKILQIRNRVTHHLHYRLGKVDKASAWFDNWDDHFPLMNHLTYRRVINAGFSLQDKVVNVISNGAWCWPIAWYNLSPILNQVTVPVLNDEQEDKLLWKNHDGVMQEFSVREVWNTIRNRGEEIEWFHMVWSTYCIPRHAIHLWLVIFLKTQDMRGQWDVGTDIDLTMLRCPLCKTQPDTHAHLFFECAYSANVWTQVLKAADLPNISPVYDDIMDWMIPRSSRNNVRSIVGRLVVAASSYFVWQERNNRIHDEGERNPENVTNIVIDMVRLKLASIRFKKNVRVDRVNLTSKLSIEEHN